MSFEAKVPRIGTYSTKGAPIAMGTLGKIDGEIDAGAIKSINIEDMFSYDYAVQKENSALTHLHPVVETVWVAKGPYHDPEFVDVVGEYKTGQTVQYPAHSIHTPTSDDGALLFCISRFPKFNSRRADQPDSENPLLKHLTEHGAEVAQVMGVPAETLIEFYRQNQVVRPAKA